MPNSSMNIQPALTKSQDYNQEKHKIHKWFHIHQKFNRQDKKTLTHIGLLCYRFTTNDTMRYHMVD